MQRCLELASAGLGKVHPNPMVGCVIVRNGHIIGEGSHQQFGGPHAEIFALSRAGKKSKGATLVTNLEPCVHFGKTPPCVDAIIHSRISQVVIATEDPNPLVKGKGIRKLRDAGIQVHIGVMKKEAERLNEKFFKFMKTGTPFVGIKIAQTLDGYIADISGKSQWITSMEARREVHRLRGQYDAVLIGANTVLKDDPELTARFTRGRNPVRIVVDGRLSLPVHRKIFNISKAPTWILTSTLALRTKKQKVHAFALRGVRVLGGTAKNQLSGKEILRMLASAGISSVLVEGGSKTIAEFISQDLGDKLYLFMAPRILGGGLKSFQLCHPRHLADSIDLDSIHQYSVGNSTVLEASFNH